jgi:hypothetical protein
MDKVAKTIKKIPAIFPGKPMGGSGNEKMEENHDGWGSGRLNPLRKLFGLGGAL